MCSNLFFRTFFFILLYTGLFISGKGQSIENTNSILLPDEDIKIELLVTKDTVHPEQPNPVYISITNLSKNTIYVPANIDVTSNLFPNGWNEIWDGALVHLSIGDTNNFASVHQENTAISSMVEFIKIKPGATVKQLALDLSAHINTFNQSIDTEGLRLKTSRYTLDATYGYNRRPEKRKKYVLVGRVEFKTVSVYVK